MKRINITLPDKTVSLVDRVTQKRERSRFINDAVTFYLSEMRRQEIRSKLKEGAIKRAQQDLEVAQDWFKLENEAWQPKKK